MSCVLAADNAGPTTPGILSADGGGPAVAVAR
jgi:hypothetical protein